MCLAGKNPLQNRIKEDAGENGGGDSQKSVHDNEYTLKTLKNLSICEVFISSESTSRRVGQPNYRQRRY